MGAPLLTLETLAPDRATISIDGSIYELNRSDDLNVEQLAMILRAQKRIDELGEMTGDDLTPDQTRTVRTMLAEAVGALVRELPTTVLERLSDVQRLQLLEAFNGATGKAATSPTNRAARRARKPKAQRTSGSSSRSSRASTGATR